MKETNSLLRLSPLKKKKLSEILRMLGDASGKTCIDIGGDNGVISYYLRKNGGDWTSADLDDETVRSIRSLVGGRVVKTSGRGLPFKDNVFDAAVIVDFLEHIQDDSAIILELRRVLKPGGKLVINVPERRDSFPRRLMAAAGYTDEKHGHLRPGYSTGELASLLAGSFKITETASYTGFFTELADALANIAVFKAGKGETGGKGNVITSEKAGRKKGFLPLALVAYRLMETATRLDAIVPRKSGANLIAGAENLKHDHSFSPEERPEHDNAS